MFFVDLQVYIVSAISCVLRLAVCQLLDKLIKRVDTNAVREFRESWLSGRASDEYDWYYMAVSFLRDRVTHLLAAVRSIPLISFSVKVLRTCVGWVRSLYGVLVEGKPRAAADAAVGVGNASTHRCKMGGRCKAHGNQGIKSSKNTLVYSTVDRSKTQRAVEAEVPETVKRKRTSKSKDLSTCCRNLARLAVHTAASFVPTPISLMVRWLREMVSPVIREFKASRRRQGGTTYGHREIRLYDNEDGEQSS